MGVNRSVVAIEIISPDLFKKLLTGHCDIHILRKIEEDVILLRGHLGFLSVDDYFTCGEVYFKSLISQDIDRIGVLSSLDGNLDTSHELFRGERLHNIVVDSHFKAEELVIFLTTCGKHDDGCV